MSQPWPTRVLLLAPQLWSADGGVQRYGRSLLEAMQQVRPSAQVQVLALLDQPGRWQRLSFLLAALLAVRQRPQLVLCTHLHLAPLGWLVARLSSGQLWVSLHGIEAWRPLRGLRRWALLHSNHLLPVSRYTAEQVQQQLDPRMPPWSLLLNTYDAERFQPGPRPVALLKLYGLSPEQPLFFALTRLSVGDRHKHLDRVIAAMVDVRRSHPQAMLLIAGDGDDRPRLQQLVHQLDLQAAVLLPGRLSEDELADHYRLASAFVLPSEKEGFGIVFLEALGCGRPVLAGNRDGSREPLADGRFGLLVDPDQPLAPFLQALIEQQGDPLWYQPEALSAAVAEAFAFPAFCRRLEELLATRGPYR